MEAFIKAQHYCQQLYYTNFSINFALYCISGQNFRKALRSLHCPRRRLLRNETAALTGMTVFQFTLGDVPINHIVANCCELSVKIVVANFQRVGLSQVCFLLHHEGVDCLILQTAKRLHKLIQRRLLENTDTGKFRGVKMRPAAKGRWIWVPLYFYYINECEGEIRCT